VYSPYQYALLVLAFSATGIVLIAAHTKDQRAVWLGCILLLTAAPFAETLAGWGAGARPLFRTSLLLLERVPVVPLLAVFCWLFVRHFPVETTSRAGLRVLQVATRMSLAVAIVLVLSNLSEIVWPGPAGAAHDLRSTISRQSDRSLYWPLIIATGLPAFAFLAWKTRSARVAERRRARMFVTGLVLGFLPIGLTVLLEALSPAYARLVTGSAGEWVAYLVFLSLVAVPLVTAYSVMVDRVVEIRLVIRSALQYALAKYTLLAIVAVPLAGMAWYLYRHRDRTLLELVSGPGVLLLAAAAVAASIMLQTRHRALKALDRRFFREQYDSRRILNELADRCRKAATVDELVSLVCREVDRALHLDYVTVLLATPDGSVLRSPDGRIRPLSPSSGLAFLAKGDTAPLLVDLENDDSTLRRLPEEERTWLVDSGFGLLVPLNAGDGSLQGLIGLGHKLSELPFSREDRLLLEAIGASVSLTVENRRLRDSASSAAKQARPVTPQPDRRVDDTRPAMECEGCGRVYPPDTAVCDCGADLDPSLVPFVLSGKFQLDRRLGRGGMGVVYRGLDMDLGRHVALKTLPHVGPDDAARLRREAKAMAAVQHENLAIIFGAETWFGTPILVVELLAGGTLAERLRNGRVAYPRALEIGIALARGIEHLHRAGVLHCDIKPSNIGFTRDDVPKLLDFGLATILRERLASGNTTTRSGSAMGRFAAVTPIGDPGVLHFGGTPRYMSPEAMAGHPPQQASDVWSLSVVLFEMIAGRPPFDGASLAAIAESILGAPPDIRVHCPACPPSIADFFTRALSNRTSERPATAVDLGRELSLLRGA
jgi:hypothetical protein